MADSNPLGDRGKALEDEYFRRKDRELIERLRETAAANALRRELGELTGLDDADVTALQSLGFTAETVALLPFLPLIQIAWAEGGVTDKERQLLVEFARARGIADGSASDAQLSRWLDTPPSREVYDGAARLTRAMLDDSGSVQGLSEGELLDYCERIATASGGLFGRGKISTEERALLASIAGARRSSN